jgi:hypothetical protein
MKHFEMMMMTSIIILSACAGGGSGSGSGSKVPGQVNQDMAQQIRKHSPISDLAKAKLANMMKLQVSKLPATSLLLHATDSANSSENQKNIAKLDADGVENLRKMNEICQIKAAPETSGSAAEINKLQVTEKTDTIGGTGCPIAFSDHSKSSMLMTAFDKTTSAMSGTYSVSGESSLKIITDVLKQQTTIGGYSVKINVEGVYEGFTWNQDAKNASGASYTHGSGEGTFDTADGFQIPSNVKIEIIQRNGKKDAQYAMIFKLAEGEFVIGQISHDGTHENFVNGESYSDERLKMEFGLETDELMK